MIYIIAYPPCAGGNHLKNIVSLDGKFDDQWPWQWVRDQTVGLDVYYDKKRPMRGEVQSLPGRNLHEVFVDHILENPDRDFLIHGHFGELALYRQQLLQMPDKKVLMLTIDCASEREWLINRQTRLGQNNHPYWVNEEQIYLYRTDIYQTYFGIDSVQSLPLTKMMSDTLEPDFFNQLNEFFDINIDTIKAQEIHKIWAELNR